MITLTGEYTEEMAAAAAETFRALSLSGEASAEVVFADEEEIRELNA